MCSSNIFIILLINETKKKKKCITNSVGVILQVAYDTNRVVVYNIHNGVLFFYIAYYSILPNTKHNCTTKCVGDLRKKNIYLNITF